MSHSNTPKTLHVATPGSLGPVTPEEAGLLEKLDLTRLPRHVAVIMDGNGRWAQKRHLPRIAGHRSGTQSARTTIETCARLKIEALTLYAFSVENWRRPKTEIDFLMALLREYLRKEMPLIQKNNIRMRSLGRMDELPTGVQNDVRDAMEKTAGNQGMVLCVALNYGGRAEIVDAMSDPFRTQWPRIVDQGDRGAALAALVYRGPAGPRSADPHQWRDAREQFSALADCLCGNLRDGDALAGLQPGAVARGVAGIPEARAPLWRDPRR